MKRGFPHVVMLQPELVTFLREESRRLKLPQGVIITRALAVYLRPDARAASTEYARRFRIAFGLPAPPEQQPLVCPCETDVDNPGPHLPSCPYRDPNYDPAL